ncbi:hypothetical protein Tco_1061484 [Tanacetum coccineum]
MFPKHHVILAKVQEKLDEEEIDKMVEGNTYEESYASEFADSILNDEGADVDDIGINKDREVSPVDISGMVSKEFSTHGPKLIEEFFRKHMQNTTLNIYPKTSSSTASTSFTDLQQQLYLNMKAKPQDQAADPEIWEILKAKFEKSYIFSHISR